MRKRVVDAPEWMGAPRVRGVFSISGCVSPSFGDYTACWKHNGYWFFDHPGTIDEVARALGEDIGGTTLFYHELFPQQFDEATRGWGPVHPAAGLATEVVVPQAKALQGYDVVTYMDGACPGCSPLSCNGLAATIETNERCLFETLDAARGALDAGAFVNSEPGPFRIVAVHLVPEPT